MIDISELQEIYTVTRLNREVRFLLEGSLPPLWVEGEISNFAAPHSGHWYFSLKDETAQVRCAMFRPQNRLLSFKPKDGMHVLAKARVSLYEGRGEFQLLIETLEEAGLGKLQKEFERLKKRLAEKGLFDAQHKKSLPNFPRCIGIITSTTGAAVRDILHVLKRRFPSAAVIIYPTLVQGDLAAPEIVSALQSAEKHHACDVLILARGGGSIEDLWPFNEEIVAQAIFDCSIPIVSGVGHEIDFTIADFVADVRAPTPSVAAELVVPDKNELLAIVLKNEKTLFRAIQQTLMASKQHLAWTAKHLNQLHPKHRLLEKIQQLDLSEAKLVRLLFEQLTHLQNQLKHLTLQLFAATPLHRIEKLRPALAGQANHLQHLMLNTLQQYQKALIQSSAKLDTLSPLATLKRGFTMTTNQKTGEIVRSIQQIHPGDNVMVRLLDGSFTSIVKTKEE